MVRIRLRRVGAKKQPSFRVVAADKESPRDGRFIENLGHYNPRTEPATISLKEDRIYDWMMKGAQPSDAVKQLFTTVGLFDRYERFKAGEELAVLLEEAATAEAARNVDPKTRRDAKPKSKPKVQEAAKVEEKISAADVEEADEPEEAEEAPVAVEAEDAEA
jgi:small subunit ribosomal protein S16